MRRSTTRSGDPNIRSFTATRTTPSGRPPPPSRTSSINCTNTTNSSVPVGQVIAISPPLAARHHNSRRNSTWPFTTLFTATPNGRNSFSSRCAASTLTESRYKHIKMMISLDLTLIKWSINLIFRAASSLKTTNVVVGSRWNKLSALTKYLSPSTRTPVSNIIAHLIINCECCCVFIDFFLLRLYRRHAVPEWIGHLLDVGEQTATSRPHHSDRRAIANQRARLCDSDDCGCPRHSARLFLPGRQHPVP